MRGIKRILFVSGIIAALAFVYLIFIDQYVQRTGAKYISDGEAVPEAEALLILGANVFPDGTVSLMLHDRLTQGYELYKSGKARKIIVSGDHSRKDYYVLATFIKPKPTFLGEEIPVTGDGRATEDE